MTASSSPITAWIWKSMSTTRRGRSAREYGIPDDVPLVGMVGIMYAPKRYLLQRRGLKGHEDLIDALAIVLKERPDAMGVFVGGGWGGARAYEERVRAYAKEQCGDRALFLGMRADVPELLPDFDIAVQPSHTEGVAGTAVEAQLLGIPVIATNVGGQPDLIVGWRDGLARAAEGPARDGGGDPRRARPPRADARDGRAGARPRRRRSSMARRTTRTSLRCTRASSNARGGHRCTVASVNACLISP